jgi:hypothetical protein
MSGTALYEESQGFGPWMFAVVGLVIVLVVALGSLRMKTIVTGDSVTIRYGFLNTTRVPVRDIARAEAIVYRPVHDYGGWGVRGFGRRRALNARGDRGVLLVRTDGSTLLVGSQNPRELLSALSRAGVPAEDKLPPDIREF